MIFSHSMNGIFFIFWIVRFIASGQTFFYTKSVISVLIDLYNAINKF